MCQFGFADQSFQSLVLFFFLKNSQSSALLRSVRQLTSQMASVSEDDADNTAGDHGDSMFDMECQNISTHVAGCREIQPMPDPAPPGEDRMSPIFGRRPIQKVKSTAGLRALHAYDGCDPDDDPEDPIPSNSASTGQIEEIVVPVGFNSHIIK